ncbi:MAG: HAD family hydrolase [Treponema sp.]|jgi:FMN phosphatase YigB (HAD superfamily)|nr:HAD family hydrolase [Treponema sp.]
MDSSSALAGRLKEAQAFIFDLDGTLYDTHGFAWRLIQVRPWEGFLIAAERMTRKGLAGADYGSPEAYYQEVFSRMSRITGKAPEWLRNWYTDCYMPRMCQVLQKYYHPRPRTAELLAGLVQGSFPFAVYSDYPAGVERLAALGLDPGVCSSAIYGPEHFGAQKPAIRPFVAIAQDLGVLSNRIIVVGDRDDTDGAGAAAAGMGYFPVMKEVAWETFTSLCLGIHDVAHLF